MAYAAFADAPVDVAVVEVGIGGEWDATNVADGTVAVVTPIAVDHAGTSETPVEVIAVEKAGIIKPGATRCSPSSRRRPAKVLLRRCAEVGVTPVREGLEFAVVSRVPAVGGQCCPCGAARRIRRGVPAALRRAPGAERRRRARGRRGFVGDQALGDDVVRDAFGRATSPGASRSCAAAR